MKLISMTDFVLDQYEKLKSPTLFEETVFNYANFLKQPLKLEMFIPCDENSNVLEIPIDIYYRPDFDCQKFPQECYQHDLKDYDEAKAKVLFKDCTACKPMSNSDYYVVDFNGMKIWLTNTSRMIEDLVQCDLSLAVSFEAII